MVKRRGQVTTRAVAKLETNRENVELRVLKITRRGKKKGETISQKYIRFVTMKVVGRDAVFIVRHSSVDVTHQIMKIYTIRDQDRRE